MSQRKHMRVGAIDIGSNSVRLLVADVEPRDGGPDLITTVARAGEACRLARGLDRLGAVSAEVAGRASQLAAEFAERARALGAVHTVIGATAALRRAVNGAEVAAAIGERAGLPVRILSGDEEARLVYQSVILGLGAPVRTHSCVVFDIGGGSTEVVSGVGDRPGRWTSLPFGAVSLTERHLRSNPPGPDEIESLSAEVNGHLMHYCALMPRQAPVLAGVGGTVTVLAAMDRSLSSYDPGELEGWLIQRARLEALVERLVHSSQEERGSWPVMGVGRADIVVAGALAVRLLVQRFPSSGLVCSTQGLRYGLVRIAAGEARATGGAPGRRPAGGSA